MGLGLVGSVALATFAVVFFFLVMYCNVHRDVLFLVRAFIVVGLGVGCYAALALALAKALRKGQNEYLAEGRAMLERLGW